MKYERRKTKAVRVGDLLIGGGAPITVQSMTNTNTHDIESTYRQVLRLVGAGCDIIRITTPDLESVQTLRAIRERGVMAPLVADVHFDYRIAVAAAKAGVSKLRINPGNIGSRDKVGEVVRACTEYGVPIRIGVNSGSLEPELLKKYGSPTAEALAESALGHAAILEELGFENTVISVKASSVPTMIEANRILAERTSYPLHLGVTEAGARTSAIVKSSIGVGTLLAEGIGDTIRISLTDDPVEEVSCAREILRALSLTDKPGLEIISCPTCGRTGIDLVDLVRRFEERTKALGLCDVNAKVALMGCAVNGPGEAREADVGIAGGKGEALLFKKGTIISKIPEDSIIDVLCDEIKKIKSSN